jgi:hypothetical protein
VRKVAIVTSASGCGGTTVGRKLAARIGVPFTLRHFRARRRTYPERFETYDVVRLRSQREIDAFLASVGPAT